MDSLPLNVRKAFEQYINGNKKEAFESLIPGSEYHSYLFIIDSFKINKGIVDEKTRELIARFKKNWAGFEAERVELQSYLLQYDAAETNEEKRKLISEIDKNFVQGYYDYSKPAEIKGVKDKRSRDHNRSPNTKKINNVFIQEKYFNVESTLKQVYKNDQNLGQLQKSLLNKVDYTKLSDKAFLTFLNVCQNIRDLSAKSFMTKLVTFFKNNYKINRHYIVNCSHLDKLTIEQLEELGSKCPYIKEDKNFIGKTFEKKFHFELDDNNKDLFSLDERREQLIRMYEASTERPQSFRSALLLEILENGMKLDIYDKKYFIEYLEHPLKTWHLNKQKNSHDTQDYGWNTYIYNLQSRQGGVMSASLEGRMYKKYLETFYREKGDLLEFNDYFSAKFLNSLAEEFYFLSGKELNTDKIDFEKYDRLASSVQIELLSCNKDSFNPEERVVIHAELKNVPTMHIKIFEFNSLNYYKKNCQPFKTDVNLDGFVTSFEKTLKFDDVSCQKKFKQSFEFEELDNKKGLFVIEFISNGYSSRAIVKKGALSVIYKQRISGQIAYIIDENREICIGDDTGLYFKNQFFKADPDKSGRILIPYEKHRVTDNAILVHNEFAQLVQFTRHAENYSLEVAYIFPPENLIMGNQASIILRPCLKINNRK